MPPLVPARILTVALLAALGIGVAGPPPAAAVETIPPEGGEVLPGRTHGAIVGDVDGDGIRELVRLLPLDTSPGMLAVEVVAVDGDMPSQRGQVLVRRAASVDDHVAGNNPSEAELLPLSTNEPARLIAWRDGDRERILLATMQGDPTSVAIERACCLTLWWVGTDASGTTVLRYIQNTVASGAWMVAADMDADGTDELAVVETPNSAMPNAAEVMVLRWNGHDFDRLRATARDGLISGPLTVLGDSDGQPGDEVGFVAEPARFDATAPTLHRLALAGGELRVERTELPERGSVLPIAGSDGGRLALVSGTGVQLLRWPARAADAEVELSSPRGGAALGVLGRGEEARLLVLRGGAVDLLDAGLRSRQGLPGGPAAAWFTGSSLPPYHGELPGGDEVGTPAILFGGRLIGAPDGGSQATSREIAVLGGRTPVGLLGPDRAWAAVAAGPSLPVERRGGNLLVGAGARAADIAIIPAAAVLAPAADGGLLAPEIVGAVIDDSQPARPILVTNGEVRARIDAPPGSVLQVTTRGGERIEGGVGERGADAVIVPAVESADNETFTVRLLVSTPAGQGYGAIWEARVLRQPPGLRAEAPFAPFSFRVTIDGRTAPAATLAVDGDPVAVGPDGAFAAEVDAGLLPRGVSLVATDAVGNATELVVEVVALVDYRRLPWVPLVVLMTLVAGAVLFLRTPRPAATGAQHPDEGVLEEIQ